MRFDPITSERLLLRRFRPEDEADLLARRNDPDVARFQNWTLPYPAEEARAIAASLGAMQGPADGEWYMVVVADRHDGTTYGDLALRLAWGGRMAEIGYTLASAHWGNGYATEAVAALLEWLFTEVGVTRVEGKLHPDNVASARVLERTGFLHEGRTRLSYWVGDENSDDDLYGLTRDDWEAWRTRPKHPPETVDLMEISHANVGSVERLRTHKSQERFVAPMSASFADALFPEEIEGAPVVPWMRAVTADGDIAGFVMLAMVTEHHPEPYLWRLLIDRTHQRRGIGSRVLGLVVEQCRQWGASTLLTSWSEGHGTPEPFYLSYGFEKTGRIVDGELEARLSFERLAD